MFGDMSPFLPVLGVLTRKFLLMHYPHHCTYMIRWSCYNVTAYHTPTSFLLVIDILQIDIGKIRLNICVPHVVR